MLQIFVNTKNVFLSCTKLDIGTKNEILRQGAVQSAHGATAAWGCVQGCACRPMGLRLDSKSSRKLGCSSGLALG